VRSIRLFAYAFVVLLLIMGAAIFLFMRLEHMTFMDALWLTVASVSTVGFGEGPRTTGGRVVTIALIVTGVAVFTFLLSNVSAILVEGKLRDFWGRRRMDNAIARLSGHIVVCGAGRVGGQVISHLRQEKTPFVVIERDEKLLADLRADGSILFLAGDATEDRLLLEAGVQKAAGVITTLAEDAGNLFITVSCRDLNPRLRVVARANRPESVLKLKRAGAAVVVCPSSIAGSRMVLAATKPASVAFVESLMEERNINLELEEVFLSGAHPFINRELRASGLRENYDTLVLAIRRAEQTIINPCATERLLEGDVLIVCGPPDRLALLEKG